MAEESTAIKERLLKFFKSKNLKMAEVERTADLANGYLRNSKGEIGASKLRNILIAYPDLNMNWLLTGIGAMIQNNGGDLNQFGENAKGVKDGTMVINEKTILEEHVDDFDILNTDVDIISKDVRREVLKARQWYKELELAQDEIATLQRKVDDLEKKCEDERVKRDEATSELIQLLRERVKI